MNSTRCKYYGCGVATCGHILRSIVADNRYPLSSLLIRLRKAAGLSVRDLEKLTGINRSNISRAESGEQAPNPETLVKLAEALGADVSELLTAAGYTASRAEGLPSFRPYLRAKYAHLPASAQKELAGYLERLEAEYGPKAATPATRRPSKPKSKTT